MSGRDDRILVMDSGLGGLSVLRTLIRNLPTENYIYHGDSKNVPYGEKTREQIASLVIPTISHFIDNYSIKACVIGCNTISVSVLDVIKETFPDLIVAETVPVIDEPLSEFKEGKLLVLSTPVTAGSEYIRNKIKEHQDRTILSLGLPNLIDYVEALDFDSERLFAYFDEHLKMYLFDDIKAVSLGCTHYPFVRDILDSYLKKNGINAKFFEGSDVTLKRLLKSLDEKDLRSSNGSCEVEIFNSLGDEMIEKSRKLLSL